MARRIFLDWVRAVVSWVRCSGVRVGFGGGGGAGGAVGAGGLIGGLSGGCWGELIDVVLGEIAERLVGVVCGREVAHGPHPCPLPHALNWCAKWRGRARAGEGGRGAAERKS